MISLLPARVSSVRFITEYKTLSVAYYLPQPLLPPVYIECVVLIRAVLLASVVLHHHLQGRPPATETNQEPAGLQLVRGQLKVESLVVDRILGVDLHGRLLLLDQSPGLVEHQNSHVGI